MRQQESTKVVTFTTIALCAFMVVLGWAGLALFVFAILIYAFIKAPSAQVEPEPSPVRGQSRRYRTVHLAHGSRIRRPIHH